MSQQAVVALISPSLGAVLVAHAARDHGLRAEGEVVSRDWARR